MQAANLDAILVRLRETLERDDLTTAVAIIEGLRPPDQAELFAELHDDDQAILLPELKPGDSADILEELDDDEAAELVAGLPTHTLIRIVEEMEPDEAADLLGDIDPVQARAVLAGLEDPEEVRPLLLHSDDSAGGLMTSEFLALRRRMTAAEALTALRTWKPDSENIYYLFVVDRYGKLAGVVNLRQLVVADPDTKLIDIMDPEVIFVPVGTDQEECAQIMARYDLLALPVVSEDHTLVGVITIDDVVDVLEDEATEDIQRLGGAEPLDRPYLDTGVFIVTRKRIGWLLLLFLTETLTGSVLRLFEEELQTAVALAFFVPLLIGTGGNAGSQTTSTIIRALAVGDLELKHVLRSLWHELRIGLLLGVGMAVVAYGRAMLWGTGQEVALTVSIAIFCIVVWANGLGSLLPLLATWLKVDPTVVSGPAMSTLVDATGLFIYFTVARIVLGL
ncbi:MAG: magnesium transporter [Chloroflexi bacterium]|nr:magnesium transporter [Chloroflexota bacterium]MCI0576609.1 magnesium transporter [Chloroflexota bacterium]MCI0647023.1 magnesium transporter [Chloroflexota bacterium]MCI0730723.1 magnesium transporter [Chloroflexota bacterium]